MADKPNPPRGERSASMGTALSDRPHLPMRRLTPTAWLTSTLALSLALSGSVAFTPLVGAQAGPEAVAPVLAPEGHARFSLIPGASEVRYRIGLSFLGGQPRLAYCRTRDVVGDIFVAPDGAVNPLLSKIMVDQRTLRCEAPMNDANVQRTLDTAQFPISEFALREAPGLPFPFPTSGEAAPQLIGEQTVHGVTRQAIYQTKMLFAEQEAAGLTTTAIKMTDFGMTPPRIGPIIAVMDDLLVELDFKAACFQPQ